MLLLLWRNLVYRVVEWREEPVHIGNILRRVGRLLARSSLVWPLLVVALYAWQTAHQIRTWRSNLTLWQHAVTIVPQKPRVLHNYGLALLEAGEINAAVTRFRAAVTAAEAPHVPAWDRRITNRDVVANLKALRGALSR